MVRYDIIESASIGFSPAWLQTFTKSFASPFSRLTMRLTRKRRERLRKRFKSCGKKTSARRVHIIVLSRMYSTIVTQTQKNEKYHINCKRRFYIYWDERVGKSEITFWFLPHTWLGIMRKFPNPSRLVQNFSSLALGKIGTSRREEGCSNENVYKGRCLVNKTRTLHVHHAL